MGVTESDAARDEWIDELREEFRLELHDEISEEAVRTFTRELAYKALKGLSPQVLKVKAVLDEAEAVRSVSPSATVLFAASAVEITLKKLILEPLIVGLIHNEGAAEFFTRALVGQHSLKLARERVVELLEKVVGYDLKQYVRTGASISLLNETIALAKQRDGIVHRGDKATEADAAQALTLAAETLDGVFDTVLGYFDLRLIRHDDEARGYLFPRELMIGNAGGRARKLRGGA